MRSHSTRIKLLEFVLLLQFSFMEILAPFANAQVVLQDGSSVDFADSDGIPRQNPAVVLGDLTQALSLLEAHPDTNVATTLFLPASLRALREMARQNTTTNELVQYTLLDHNRIVNAAVLADQVFDLTHDTQIKNLVFSSVLDIIPDLNPSAAGAASGRPNLDAFINFPTGVAARDLTNEHYLYATRSLITGAKRKQREISDAANISASQFRHALILENEKNLVRSYWYYRGLYDRDLPPSTSAGIDSAIRNDARLLRRLETADYSQIASAFLDAKTQVLNQAGVCGLDGVSRVTAARRSQNVTELTARLNRARDQMVTAIRAAEQSERNPRYLKAARVWNSFIAPLDDFFRRWPDVQESSLLNPSLQWRSETGQTSLSSAEFSRVLMALLRHPTLAQASSCQSNGRVSIPRELEDGTNVRERLQRYFELLFPGRGPVILAQFLSYANQTAPLPRQGANSREGDGCVSSSAPQGYDRSTWFRNFIASVFEGRFGVAHPSQLTLSPQYHHVRLQMIANEPLLETEALRQTYDPDTTISWQGPITEVLVRQALDEQASTIRARFEDLARFEAAAASQNTAIIGELMLRNPVAAWRLVARDWRYLDAMAQGYAARNTLQRSENLRRDHWAVAGMVLSAGFAVGTAGAGLLIEGLAGSVLIALGTTTGFVLGAHDYWHSSARTGLLHDRFEQMRTQVLASVQSDPALIAQADQLLSEFNTALSNAVVEGVFLATSAVAMLDGIATMRQVAAARTMLQRTGPAGAISSELEIEAGIAFRRQHRILGIFERRANVQASRINEILTQNSTRDVQEWLRAILNNRDTSIEELIAWGMKRFETQGFSSVVGDALEAGYTFRFPDRLARLFARALRLQGARVDVTRPGFLARLLLGPFHYRSITAARPVLTNAAEVNEFFGTLFEMTEQVVHPDPSIFSALIDLEGAMGRAAMRTVTESDLRPGSVVKALLDEILTILDRPQEILMRHRSLAQALGSNSATLPDYSAQYREILNDSLTARGGWVAVFRRVATNPDGTVNQEVVHRYALAIRSLWFGFWGGIGLSSTYEIGRDLASRSSRLYRNAQRLAGHDNIPNPNIPEGVRALISSSNAPESLMDGSHAQAGLDQARSVAIDYHRLLSLRDEAVTMRHRCLGEQQPPLQMCSTPEGRARTLAIIENQAQSVDSDIESMESQIRALPGNFQNPDDYLRSLEASVRQ